MADKLGLTLFLLTATLKILYFVANRAGWRSGESTRLPPKWPGIESWIRCHIRVEFSTLLREIFLPVHVLRFSPLLKNQHLFDWICSGFSWFVVSPIDHFRYIKIQSKTKGIISRLWGINSYKSLHLFHRSSR